MLVSNCEKQVKLPAAAQWLYGWREGRSSRRREAPPIGSAGRRRRRRGGGEVRRSRLATVAVHRWEGSGRVVFSSVKERRRHLGRGCERTPDGETDR